MSKTFKRPMFRKGGTTGGGIMDNVVERGQYADSNIKDLSIKEKIQLVENLGGSDRGLGDPLTQFLLQVGPNIATQTGGGGIIPNILGASKEPIQDLIEAQRDKRKTRQAIGLEFIKDLSDSDKIALQEKIEYLMSEEGGGFSKEKAFNMVLPEFRKRKDPQDIARDELSTNIESIITSTENRFGTPTIDYEQAQLIYQDVQNLKEINPEAYNQFLRTRSQDKYIFGSREYNDANKTLTDDSILKNIPENRYVYDIEKGKFIYRQGNKVFDLETGE